MAKKLLATNYSINADSDKITIKGFYRGEQFQLITDVTPNSGGTILYNFADVTKGYEQVSFDEQTEETTITLETDLSALGIDSNSAIQIIVDHPENEVEVSDALLDPVHKIRVSTPENLIDTDFEYGLQPTKWETLELSNNVPSFYIADGDTALSIVSRVLATNGSDLIKVECTDQHNLTVGAPIDVSGLDFRTAEGKFLVASADSNNFYYRANAEQTRTGEIGSLYTAITPGAFYSGSQIAYAQDSGLTTDGDSNSNITVNTVDVHGFVENSSFYLVNTVASKSIKLQDSGLAPDSRSYIDPVETIEQAVTLDLSKTHTTQIRGRWSHYFNNDAIDTSTNRITWTGHQLRTNYTLLYNPPAGGAQIGGLNRMDIYYVRFVDQNTIELSETYNGAAINFSSAGDDSYAQHSLHLVYEIRYSSGNYRNSYTYHYPWSWQYGANASGYDIRTYSDNSYGLGSGNPDGSMIMVRQYAYPADQLQWLSYYVPEYHQYHTRYGTTQSYWRIPEYDPNGVTNQPSRWNPLEDFERWRSYNWSGYAAYYNQSSPYIRMQKYYWHGTYRYYWANRRVFVFPFIYDLEADTFYAENHGLEAGSTVSFATKSGSAPVIHEGNTTIGNTNATSTLADGDYSVEVPSPDRFRLTGKRIVEAKGDSDGAYEIIGNLLNPTRNSIYIPNHGLIDGQNVTLTTTGSPTLPAVPSGNLAPRWGQAGNNVLAFNVVHNYLENTYFPSQSEHVNFTTSNHDGSSTQLMTTGGKTNSPVQYVDTWYTNSYTTVYKNNTRLEYQYPTSTHMQLKNFNKTTPHNLFPQSSTMYQYGITKLATPWQQNASIPFYLDMTTGSHNAHEADNNNDNYWQYYNYSYTRMNAVNAYYRNFRQYYTHVGATTGDTYTYEFAVDARQRGSFEIIQINWTMVNSTSTDWYEYGTSNTNQYNYGNSSYNVHYETGQMKDNMQFRLWFMGTSSFDLDATKTRAIITGCIDAFDAGFVNPTLSNNSTVGIDLVNSNRFRLTSSTGANFDFTNSGSGINDSNFLKFTLSEVAGAADGQYIANSVDERSITLSTPFEIGGNTEVLDADQIDSDYNIPIAGGHPFVSGTKVRYTTDSALDGLTDNTDYYVYAVDDNNLQLMSDLQDALVGTNPIAVGTDSAGATHHTITTDSIAGRTKATGTVNITAGLRKITGDLTSFKRYFKAGDKFFVKDNTNDPGRLYEFTVATVSDDENMEIIETATITGTGLDHFAVTAVYTKPDGYSVHRPFDGGVEIAAGTAPLSQITRQTRKYFRYQSGKGIQTSLAINFNPPVILETVTSNGTTITCTTKYPHRLSTELTINVTGSSDSTYNGDFNVASVIDDYTFTITATATPATTIPAGIIQYTVNAYSGSYVRAGMFDNQNGFFFEWDGSVLHCVRRSSTTQLSGTVAASKGSGYIQGTNTNFNGQLVKGDKIVIRGQTYKVVKIENRTEMYVQPQYRGVDATGIILTKTIDVRVPQTNWNLDKCDGTGKEGFILDTTKIQMAYMDYSWYGAGKIRFGFKDRKGHVRYAHEFIHNNRLDEAYMRSGNLPAKYEIENDENPTYAPTLFHWGTSVIMDGTFDDDKAYLFTAPSKSLSFTNGQSNSVNTTGNSTLIRSYNRSKRTYDWFVRIPFATSDASKFQTGVKLYTAGGELNGEEVNYTDYSSSAFRVHIFIQDGWSTPGSYPVVGSPVAVSVGIPAGGAGTDEVNLGTDIIPLVSLRLAPSVDNNLTGNLGERDIINRMQLKLNEVGLILTHDCEVKLILNGDISTVNWTNVASPSLSQLITHEQGDQVTSGTEVFSFRAAGGSVDNNGIRLSNTSNFSLGDLIDMGNSILGGDGTFPNGPDILTVAVAVVDTSSINANSPFSASARITWSESQA